MGIIQRAQVLLGDATLDAIAQEIPNGHLEFENALRQEIIILRERIRVLVGVVNQLMEACTTSSQKHKTNGL